MFPKILGADTPSGGHDDFARWGYPAGFRILVGIGESIAAIFLLLPMVRVLGANLRFWGATGLGADMIGAMSTHLVHDGPMLVLLPASLLVLLALVASSAWPAILVKRPEHRRSGSDSPWANWR